MSLFRMSSFLSAWVLGISVAIAPGTGAVQEEGTTAQDTTEEMVPTPADPGTADPKGNAVLRGRVPVETPRTRLNERGHYGINTTSRIGRPDPRVSVVWLEMETSPIDPASVPVVQISQEDFQFHPTISVVRTGTAVSFPNYDSMYHNVFSFSKAKRFDVGRFLEGEEPDAIVFDVPGTVSLHCEIHEHMRGHLVVVDSPFFTLTDSEGRFELKNLPPGHHRVRVWTGPKTVLVHEVDLVEGRAIEVDWTDEEKEQ